MMGVDTEILEASLTPPDFPLPHFAMGCLSDLISLLFDVKRPSLTAL